MKQIPRTTQDYLDNPTAEGGRNDALFRAACQMRDAGYSQAEAEPMLMDCAWRDGLATFEAHKTLRSVFTRPARDPISKDGKRSALPSGINYQLAPAGKYKVKKTDLPDPLADGARELLKAAFTEGEGVRIVQGRKGEDGKDHPKDSGVTFSREDWLRRLDDADGNPNAFMSSTERAGLFITVNPLKVGGTRDADVTGYRHALLEFDDIDVREQWHIINESNVPCTAILTSGGRSVHAWVKVEAKDLAEYEQRVRMLWQHFEPYGVDQANKNPSRLSRLPNCVRFSSRQELLALNTGADGWLTWASEIQAEGIGETVTLSELAAFNTQNDPNSRLGKRWLCKGGSCLFVGQSGIGKSSLALQMAINWALGRSTFGIKPAKPLRSLFIQAENDLGDVSEMVQGSLSALGIKQGQKQFSLLEDRLTVVTDTVHTGKAFCEAVRKLVAKHKPDLVWFDPLLSFIGDDISQQKVCSEFLRNWLNPISHETGVIWMMVHHTAKPPSDKAARQHWNSTDFSYSGTGSSELTNWARAVCLLRRTSEEDFELMLAKRGKRAGAIDLQGAPTNVINLKHHDNSILWVQTNKPEPQFTANHEGRGASRKSINIDEITRKIDKPMTKKEVIRVGLGLGHSRYLMNQNWPAIEAKLTADESGLFFKNK